MDDDTEFDYDALPLQRGTGAHRADESSDDEWEPDYQSPSIAIDANDPLTATLSDLDLAPARQRLLEHAEYDAEYWNE